MSSDLVGSSQGKETKLSKQKSLILESNKVPSLKTLVRVGAKISGQLRSVLVVEIIFNVALNLFLFKDMGTVEEELTYGNYYPEVTSPFEDLAAGGSKKDWVEGLS